MWNIRKARSNKIAPFRDGLNRAPFRARFCFGGWSGRQLRRNRSWHPDAGPGGRRRSSSGRAAPLMRERCPVTISAHPTEGSTCPGGREAPAPGRGRRCPVGLGGRAVRASTHPTAETARFFPRRRAERDKPIFRWKSGPAHAGTVPRDHPSAPGGGQHLPRRTRSASPPGGAGAARSLWATGRGGWDRRVSAGAMAPAE